MTRPSLAGSPPVACLLLLGCGAVVTGWYAGWAEDRIPWWLAVVAVVMALRTLTAVGNMRRYKAWAAQWRAMGGEDDAQQAGKKHGAGWVLAGLAIVLVVGIPAYVTQIKTTLAVAGYAEVNAVLPWLWAVAGLYLAGKLLRLLWGMGRRAVAGSKARRQAQAEAAPVAWLIGRASSSPSRAAAMRNLPEYSARLIGQG